ncbi:MAG: glycogen debranching enzyme family protein [Planctomycetes bacterium]|nr:glycogen debranching enzyme family protein [Planctomycetota bacterium]
MPTHTINLAHSPHLSCSEWLLTNGLGGFAQGTACGIPDRRYHAWLIAATKPPVGRVVALHSCVEWIVIDREGVRERLCLSSYRFGGGSIGPAAPGVSTFTRGTNSCVWEWHFPQHDITVARELTLHHQRNAASIRYTINSPRLAAGLEVRPFTPMRDFHHLSRQLAGSPHAEQLDPLVLSRDGLFLRIYGRCGHPVNAAANFRQDPQWWHNFEYASDLARGQEGHEDLFSPGIFSMPARQGSFAMTLECSAAATADESAPQDSGAEEYALAREQEATHARATAGIAADHPHAATISACVYAADQFVVRRNGADDTGKPRASTSVIAGYPWFSDWGRDTCISLRGLMLTTGRLDEARRTLEAFAELREGGLIPNCFDNGSGSPEYNTADASLWYLIAAADYARAANEKIDGLILGACLDIIKAYRDGTAFGIGMDPSDGLITAGTPGTQLTWMDAKRDGVVFTPRHGKPVELSALWYAGLLEVASLLPEWYLDSARQLPELAKWVGRNFASAFWNEKGRCLYDCLTPRIADGVVVAWEPQADIRPNQIFAVSLPHSPLSKDQRRGVLECVRKNLLTPMGLRTLAPGTCGYCSRYEGSLFERDRAYHNGTVWPWLLGAYAEAFMRHSEFNAPSRDEARDVLEPLARELLGVRDSAGPILQLAEIYDADEPRRPQGCPAQAWSVAELLRVLVMTYASRE